MHEAYDSFCTANRCKKYARHVLIGGDVEDNSEPQNNDVLNMEHDSPAAAVVVVAAVVVDAVATLPPLPVQQLEQEEDPPEKLLLFGSTTA